MKKKIVDVPKYREQKKLALNRNEQKTGVGGGGWGLPQGTSYRSVVEKIEGIILGKLQFQGWRGGGGSMSWTRVRAPNYAHHL